MSTTKHKCVLCELEFNDKQTLQIHFRKHGEKNNLYQEENRLQDKQEEVAGPSPGLVRCDVCPEQFPSIARAISHMHKVHRNQYIKHLCPWCGKQFPIKHLWEIHMKSHSSEVEDEPEELYSCDRCEFDFYNKSAIQYHTSSFHREEMIAGAGTVTPGGNMLVTPQVLPSKQMKVTPNRGTCAVYYCKHCGCEYFNPNHLLKHIEYNHKNLESSPSNMILCSVCDSVFCNSAAYKVHMIYHKNEDNYIDSDAVQSKLVQDRVRETQTNKEDSIDENDSETNSQCWIGTKSVKDNVSLEEQSSSSGLVSCDVCPRQCPSIAAAISHMHHAHRNAYVKHLCPWCAKQFPLKHLWEVHMKSHASEAKPKEAHTCDLCKFTFYCRLAADYHRASFHLADRAALLGHAPPPSNKLKRSANNEACLAYYCHHCGCEYISKYNLQVHISASHKDVMDEFPADVVTCDTCDSVFYNAGAYNVHLLYHKDGDTYIDKNKRSKLLTRVDGTFDCTRIPNVHGGGGDTPRAAGHRASSQEAQNGESEGDMAKIESESEGNEDADTCDEEADSNDEGDSNVEGSDSNERNEEGMDDNESEEPAHRDEFPEINTGQDLLALLAATSAADDEQRRPRKKRKKHKKSKRALTLDEFVNMNKDIFGDCIGNSIQGVEEVSHKALTNRRPRVLGQRLMKPQKIMNHPTGKTVGPGGANHAVRPNLAGNLIKGLPVKMAGVSVRPVQMSARLIRPGMSSGPRMARPGVPVPGQRMARPIVPVMVQKIARPGGSGMSNTPAPAAKLNTARPVAPIKSLGSVGPSGSVRPSGPLRPSAPVRHPGPMRPTGQVRPSGLMRPTGPSRPSVPIRPGAAVRPSGQSRPTSPMTAQKMIRPMAVGSERPANIQRISMGLSASPPPVQKPAQPEVEDDDQQLSQESVSTVKLQTANKAEEPVQKKAAGNGTSDMLEKLQRRGLISIKKTSSK